MVIQGSCRHLTPTPSDHTRTYRMQASTYVSLQRYLYDPAERSSVLGLWATCVRLGLLGGSSPAVAFSHLRASGRALTAQVYPHNNLAYLQYTSTVWGAFH